MYPLRAPIRCLSRETMTVHEDARRLIVFTIYITNLITHAVDFGEDDYLGLLSIIDTGHSRNRRGWCARRTGQFSDFSVKSQRSAMSPASGFCPAGQIPDQCNVPTQVNDRSWIKTVRAFWGGFFALGSLEKPTGGGRSRKAGAGLPEIAVPADVGFVSQRK